jgi:hypothetical protein
VRASGGFGNTAQAYALVTDKLEAQGIEVKYWGDPLTRLLKENQRLLTV